MSASAEERRLDEHAAPRCEVAASVSALAVLALHAWAPVTLAPTLWGAGTWRGIPVAWRALLLVIGITLTVLPGPGRVQAWLAGPAVPRRRLVAALAAAAVAFWLLRTEVQWGNADVVAAEAARGNVYLKHALSSAAAALVAAALAAVGRTAHGSAVALVSVLAGVLYVAGALCLGRNLFPASRVKARVVLLLLCTCGLMQEFFGVVETYPLAAAGQVWTLALLARLMRSRPQAAGAGDIAGHAGRTRRDALALLLMGGATVAAFIATVFLWPALLVAAASRRMPPWRPAALAALLAAPLLAAALVAGFGRSWSAQWAGFGGMDRTAWVPATMGDGPHVHFALLSLDHALARLDLLNLAMPAWLPLLAAALVRPRPRRSGADEPSRGLMRVLGLAALGALAFLVLVNPDMGPTLDWMQTATGTIAPFVFLMVVALAGRTDRQAAGLGLVCIGLSLLHTLPWVLVNAGWVP